MVSGTARPGEYLHLRERCGNRDYRESPLFLKTIVPIVCVLCSTGMRAPAQEAPTAGKSAPRKAPGETVLQDVFSYLNMSNEKAAEFRPLTQRERNALFGKSFINPIWYAKGAISAGL